MTSVFQYPRIPPLAAALFPESAARFAGTESTPQPLMSLPVQLPSVSQEVTEG